ncbi:MAG: GDYXXLXY domain-containing protein [Inquilinus sp.]|nr:GDYXXLXY domain-containing protein [Inquilinus sp.]
MSRPRLALFLGGLALVLGMANYAIWQKQAVVDEGRLVLLRLAPVDPRSLIQGDYMRLRYAASQGAVADIDALPWRGRFVFRLDADGVAGFVRVDDGTALAAGEFHIVYRKRGGFGGIDLGAGSYFFQEGDADLYASARYGVLRVAEDGGSVLVGLADENRETIRPD